MNLSPRHHSIKLNGSKLHYWVYGPSHGAPVIIAIHGFRGTHHGLEKIVAAAPEYTWIMPDLPGFGESTPMTTRPHNIDGYAHLFTEFIRLVTKPEETVYLLGHSFGSIIASKIAATHQENLQKLILINPIAKRPHIVGRFASHLYFGLGHALSEKQARRYFSWPLGVNTMTATLSKTSHKPTLAYIKDQHLTHFSEYSTKQTLRESFKASVNHTVSDYAPELQLPTLLIAGSKDQIAPLSTQYALLKAMNPDTELAVIPGVGHLIHYEKARQAAEFIRAFLD